MRKLILRFSVDQTHLGRIFIKNNGKLLDMLEGCVKDVKFIAINIL